MLRARVGSKRADNHHNDSKVTRLGATPVSEVQRWNGCRLVYPEGRGGECETTRDGCEHKGIFALQRTGIIWEKSGTLRPIHTRDELIRPRTEQTNWGMNWNLGVNTPINNIVMVQFVSGVNRPLPWMCSTPRVPTDPTTTQYLQWRLQSTSQPHPSHLREQNELKAQQSTFGQNKKAPQS